MLFARLIAKNLWRHPVRSMLTMASVAVALFLYCNLQSLVTTLDSGVRSARSNRLIVQSAVSLFVGLPVSYQDKIAGVEGVEEVSKWHWFGGYYQDPNNFFAQFAVDPARMLDLYPEFEIIAGSADDFVAGRTTCLIGEGLARDFEWEVGQTVPITGALFPHPDGPDAPWEFQVAGVYRPRTPSLDDRTLYFHWEYFEQTQERGDMGTPEVSVYVVRSAEGIDQTRVMAAIDGMYENGPQVVQTTTESEFQAQFVTMFGNVPFFVSAIGSAVLLAILLACVNTMLMAFREQTQDIGVMKALGFSDGRMLSYLGLQSLVLCGVGGGVGVGLTVLMEPSIRVGLGANLPNFSVESATLIAGIAITLVVSAIAGAVPAWRAARVRCIDALREVN